jgi:hypothetical protein
MELTPALIIIEAGRRRTKQMISITLLIGAVSIGMGAQGFDPVTSEDISREAALAEEALRKLNQLRDARGETPLRSAS